MEKKHLLNTLYSLMKLHIETVVFCFNFCYEIALAIKSLIIKSVYLSTKYKALIKN